MKIKAYHIKTHEPAADAVTGLESGFSLHSLFIPSRGTLFGMIAGDKDITFRDYSSPKYCDRAQAIVDGNKGGVKGEVIGEVELDEDTVQRIRNVRDIFNKLTVHPRGKFDESTSALVNILSQGSPPTHYMWQTMWHTRYDS